MQIECPEFKKENNIWNWYIYTPGQLKFLADFVNNGNNLTGTENGTDLTSYVPTDTEVTMTEETTIYLMNNLDLGAKPGDGTTKEEKWETTANENVKWIPIGTYTEENTKKLRGIFEGNNYSIRGVYVNREENNNGVFGYANSIQNLVVQSSYIKGGHNTGGIAGLVNRKNRKLP